MKKLVAKVNFELAEGGNPFNTAKSYAFLTEIEDLEKNDIVVVDTVNGLVLARFLKYDEIGDTTKSIKWIIQRVDLSTHNKRIEDARQIEVLKKKMEARRKKAQEIEIYAILAKEDPEMQAMLDQFRELNGEI